MGHYYARDGKTADRLVDRPLVFLVEMAGRLVKKENPRRAAPYLRALPFAAVVAAHFLYTTFYLRFSDLAQDLDRSGSGWTYALTQARLHVFHYLRNAFWPFPIRQEPLVTPAHSLIDVGVLVLPAGRRPQPWPRSSTA